MPEYWIGDVEGRVLGPVSLDVVQDLVNTGRLTEITRVSRDGRTIFYSQMDLPAADINVVEGFR